MKILLHQHLMTYILILGLVGVCSASTAWQAFAIEVTSGDQERPAVHGSQVVWQDNFFGNWQLITRDLVAAGPTHIIGTLGDDINPSIHDYLIVWQARLPQYQDWDIYAVDLSDTATLIPIDATGADQSHPQVYGNHIVYQNMANGNWDIGTADLLNFPNIRTRLFQRDGDQQAPAIYGYRSIMQSNASSDWDVLGMDVDGIYDGLGFAVNAYPHDQNAPALSGDWAVWQDNMTGDWDIHGKSLSQPFESEGICTVQGSDAINPALYNNVVVWQDNRNGNWDLYGYNLTTKTEFTIIICDGDQTHPAITFNPFQGGYLVVWQDNQSGNWDIYGMILDGSRVAGCASPLPWDVNADCVVDGNDYNEVVVMAGARNGISP